MTTATIPLRQQPERWLFTGFVALTLAPVLVQGLDRPLAHVFGSAPAGPRVTFGALVVAFAAWFVCAIRSAVPPHVVGIVVGVVAGVTALAFQVRLVGLFELMVVAAGTLALIWWLLARLPAVLDGLMGRHRVLAGVYVLLALLSMVQVARVSVFVADPTRLDAQVVPGLKFLETHSCLTAYVRADELAHDCVDNLYLSERWPTSINEVNPPKTSYSPFDLDAFFYPPPFLLFSEPLTLWRGDFLAQRAAWFGLHGFLMAAAFWMGARHLGGARWHRPLLLAPVFFASVPMLLLLQVGNVQALVVVAGVLAMLAFELRRPAVGGFLLAYATLAKLSPGILGLVLLAQLRWRAIAWTAAFGLGLVLVAVLVYGTNPFESWLLYALPRLNSGEAFSPMLHHTESIAVNWSPSGTPFKMALLGMDIGDPWPLARRINTIFTLPVVLLAIVFARRNLTESAQTRSGRAFAWIAILFLASLRSPFAPAYVSFGLAWLATLQSVEVETWRGGVVAVVYFLLLTIVPPLGLQGMVLYGIFISVSCMALSTWLLLRRMPGGERAA